MFGDDRLSLTARGVFAQITTVPVGEVFTASSLAAGTGDDVSVVQAGLAELETHGYLTEAAR
ncbi:hypothetical protein ACP4I1_37105 [Streptomyces sp. WG4]|uniref:hypothetical protein n=1 Tax=Streptomyces sp. WG4 TaxID=3417649 RepID=UPI003CF6F4EC